MTEEKKKRRSFEDQLRIVDRTSCEQAIRKRRRGSAGRGRADGDRSNRRVLRALVRHCRARHVPVAFEVSTRGGGARGRELTKLRERRSFRSLAVV